MRTLVGAAEPEPIRVPVIDYGRTTASGTARNLSMTIRELPDGYSITVATTGVIWNEC